MTELSIVMPAYNVSATIEMALASVGDATGDVEVIVVDDGSDDRSRLDGILSRFPGVRLVSHDCNRGMCAARNSGILASTGDYVTILDADDRLVDGWRARFRELLHEWPQATAVCFAACRTVDGEVTAAEPDYAGLLTLDDLLNERHAGEYLAIFRGDYIRTRGFVDIGTRKSCGVLSYIRFAQDRPFWVSNRVLRIYHVGRAGSVSTGWTERAKAEETVGCYTELFRRHSELYARRAPRIYRTKLLRYALYLTFARRPGAWTVWWEGAHISCLKETAVVFGLLLLGPRISAALVRAGKQSGLIRRYG